MGHNFEVENVRKVEVENVHKTVTKLKLKTFKSERCVLFMAKLKFAEIYFRYFFLVSGVLELGWSRGSFGDPTHQKKMGPGEIQGKKFFPTNLYSP